ncbi:MAG: 50S ribosomal protein L30 [Synergistales bacterium]|nr:50S ribosomal protein L30 [Synergistales bacterium]
MSKLSITWKKSAIGKPEKQKKTIQALGLKRLNQTIIKDDSPAVRGMLEKVSHLVEWSTIDG